MLYDGLHRYPFVGWNPMESIHVHRNNQKCSGKPKLRQRTDILPIVHAFSLPYGARKNTSQLANIIVREKFNGI